MFIVNLVSLNNFFVTLNLFIKLLRVYTVESLSKIYEKKEYTEDVYKRQIVRCAMINRWQKIELLES